LDVKAYRSTLILALIVAVVVGYAYVFEYKKPQEEKTAEEQKQKLFKISEDKVASIHLKWGGGETMLEKKDGVWKLTSPVQDDVDPAAVNTLLKGISEEASKALVSDKPDVDLKIFGLADPLGTIDVKTTDGTEKIVDVGQVDAIGGNKYAYIRDEKKVVAVDSGMQFKFAKTSRDLRDKRILRLPQEPIESVQIKWTDKDRKFDLSMKRVDTKWAYEGKNWKMDQHSANAFVAQLEGLRTNEFMQEQKTDPQARKKYGIDHVLARFDLKTRSGKTDSIIYNSSLFGKAYFTSALTNTVYQLLSNSVEPLKIKEDSFRDKTEPFTFDVSKVEKIEVRKENSKISLTKNGNDWKEDKPVDWFKPDAEKVKNFLDKLSATSAKEYLGAEKKKEFSQPLGSITLKSKDGVEFEFKWGRDLSADSSLAVSSKVDEAFSVTKSSIMGLPFKDLQRPEVKALGATSGSSDLPAKTGEPKSESAKEILKQKPAETPAQ
jgi:hypothetical protein